MDSVVIIDNGDGSCAVLHPAPEMFDPSSRTRALLDWPDDMSESAILDWIIKKDVPAGKAYMVIDKSLIPSSRRFRNAWKVDKEGLSVDMDRAKAMKLDEFRVLREPLLKKLDADYMMAMERGTDLQDIVSKKQALRDVTLVELPDNVADLEAFIPDILI
tara:strand:+ start:33525 stop:34004 length:480 start_codon:yes stop_codon:yes gene_type:complete